MQIIKMFSKKKACRDMLGVVTVEANATSTAPVRATMSVKVPLCGCLPRLTRSCRVASFRFKDEVEGGFSSGSHTSLTAALDLQQLLRYSRRNVAGQLKVRVMGRRQEVAVASVYLDCFLLELLRHEPAEGFVLKVQEGKLSLKMVMSPQESGLEEGSGPQLEELNTDRTAEEHEQNEPRTHTEAVTAASLPLSLSSEEQPAVVDEEIGCEDPVAVEAVTSPVLPLPEDTEEQPTSAEEQISCDDASADKAVMSTLLSQPPASAPKAAVQQTPVEWKIKISRRYRRRVLKGEETCVLTRLREQHSVALDYDARYGVMTLWGITQNIMDCRDDAEGIIKSWQREDEEARKKTGHIRKKKRQPRAKTGDNVVKTIKTIQYEQDEESDLAFEYEKMIDGADSIRVPAGRKVRSEEEHQVSVNDGKKSYCDVKNKKVKTWAEEVDEAEDSGLDVLAFPTSYCPPVKTKGADLGCCVKVKEESAEARPAAAESSQHIRSESLTSRAPDEPAAVVVLRHGRWYVCTREEAVKRRRYRPKPSRKAHSRTPK